MVSAGIDIGGLVLSALNPLWIRQIAELFWAQCEETAKDKPAIYRNPTR